MLGASMRLTPDQTLSMTLREVTLYARGVDKAEYHETCRAMTAGYLSGVIPRMKRPKKLSDYLPPEPLTKVEKRRKMWEGISDLAAQGIGKTETMTIKEFLAREERNKAKKRKKK